MALVNAMGVVISQYSTVVDGTHSQMDKSQVVLHKPAAGILKHLFADYAIHARFTPNLGSFIYDFPESTFASFPASHTINFNSGVA